MKDPAPTHARNRAIATVYLALLAVGVLFAVLGQWKPANKELLRDKTSRPASFRVWKGELFAVRAETDTLLVTASPLRGGKERILYSLQVGNRYVSILSFTDAEVRFVVAETASSTGKLSISAMNGGINTTPGQTGIVDSIYLPPQDPTTTKGARRKPDNSLRPVLRDTRRETVYRVPLGGGAPQNYTFTWSPSQLCTYAGDTIYWVEAKSFDAVRVTLPDGKFYYEIAGAISLYARPLQGGEDRLIDSKLPATLGAGGRRFSNEDGVYYLLNRPYPSPPYELLYVPIDGGKPTRIPDYHNPGAPQQYNGRLFWLESSHATDSAAHKVLSCRRDGSDRQTIPLDKDAEGEELIASALFSNNGRLFLVYYKSATFVPENGNVPGVYLRAYMARIHPDGEPLLGKPVPMPMGFRPDQAYCDGDYCYYFAEEQRKEPLDFLKPDTTQYTVITLSRFRLPSSTVRRE